MLNERSRDNKYVETSYQNHLLASLLESHLVSDICLIGPKGCGKSIIVQTLANLLGYEVEPVVLYQASLSESILSERVIILLPITTTVHLKHLALLSQDMTSRDLIQQRTTLSNGDTVWKNSPLVDAALHGKLAVLDGINRIDPSTLAILHR